MPGNPFRGYLQSYLQNIQAQHQQEQAEKAHELAVQQLEEMHQYHQGELKRQQAELDQNKNIAAHTLKQHLMENIASGIQQPPDNSQVTGFQQNNQQPSVDESGNLGTGIPTSLSKSGNSYQLSPEDLGGLAASLSPADRQINVASPERMAQLAGQKTGAVEGAKIQAELPKTQLEIAGRSAVAGQNADARLEAARITAGQRAKTGEETNATRRYAADTSAEARKYAADHNSVNKNQVNQDELGNSATDVGLGIADLPSGANGIHVQSILHGRGQVPFGKKNGGDKLDNLNDLDGIFQDMADASKQLGTGVAGQVVGGIKQHLPITTDLKNKISAIDARSPEVVRGIFGIGSGRITNTEINKATQALLSGTMTQDQAQENIGKLRRDTYTKVYSDILGAMPTKQKVAVLSQHGGLDRWRGVTINYNGQNIPVITKSKDGKEGMFDTNTGHYEVIDGYK